MAEKSSGTARFIIGIDLGTTQCSVSYVDLEDSNLKIKNFKILQLVGEGQVEELPTLPAVIYLPDEKQEFSRPDWMDEKQIIGSYARELGYEVPSRFVHSSKSWLCHPRIDRRASILPWQSEAVSEKISPVQAATDFLNHIILAWNHEMLPQNDAFAFKRQKIIVTVPASFDPSARNLTLEAIEKAGIESVSLLEEPQAAFYDYLYRNPRQMVHDLQAVDNILVVDIGGGTTDFSLIKIDWSADKNHPEFSRLAVGPHLLIGGDNLDLTLARKAEAAFKHKGRKLVAKQWLSVLSQSHLIKEQILSNQLTGKATFSITGAGSKILSGAASIKIASSEINKMLIDGFFPLVEADERPDEDNSLGISEAGLPFTRDPAITRHLAAFLHENNIIPDAVLFNGGTMKADCLRDRIYEVLSIWKGREPKILENPHPTLAVSAGAAYYGMVSLGLGQRIQSGNPVSIYLGIGTSKSSTAAKHVPQQLMCVLPKGCETEKEYRVADKTFGIDLSRDSAFYLYYTPNPPKAEQLGRVIRFNSKRYRPLPSCRLKAKTGKGEKQVELRVKLRETGYMQIFCDEKSGSFSQELRFDITEGEQNSQPKANNKRRIPFTARQLQSLKKTLQSAFDGELEYNRLFKEIEDTLGSRRSEWDTEMLRKLFDFFIEYEQEFTRNQPAHTQWFRLLGFCLRPGFGARDDVKRVDRIWQMHDLEFTYKNPEFWSDWWVMWKRTAPGLSLERQNILKNIIEPLLFPPKKQAKEMRPISQHERNQIWRLLGNLERIAVEEKERLGWWALKAPPSYGKDQLALHAVGRLGARLLAYAPDTALVPQSTANDWVAQLLRKSWPGNSYLDWALKEIGRKTGDKLVQIDDVLRKKIVDLFKKKKRKKNFIAPLVKTAKLSDKDLSEFTGDSLPSGFVWVKEA
ncbi:MAG: Hsp70 family protein [Candidatus Rifleibacteriota bacterium]